MVMFVCGNCGDSFRKEKLENHLKKRSCKLSSVSCMDCGKDFSDDTYKEHIKCISEEEKYGGKNFIPKEGKGEKKQDEWINIIRNKISDIKDKRPELQHWLNFISECSNVPRKRDKFKNFMSNNNCRKESIINELVAILFHKPIDPNYINRENGDAKIESESCAVAEPNNNFGGIEQKGRKNKRCKNDDELSTEQPVNKCSKSEDNLKVKERKETNVQGIIEHEILNSSLVDVMPSPFKWKTAIRKTLMSVPDSTMKMKKLERKVLSLYYSADGEKGHLLPQKAAVSLLHEKLKNNKFFVAGDKVKLRN